MVVGGEYDLFDRVAAVNAMEVHIHRRVGAAIEGDAKAVERAEVLRHVE